MFLINNLRKVEVKKMYKILYRIRKFTNDRNWEQFHTGENLAKSLVLEAAELLELYQWDKEIKDIERLKEELVNVLVYSIMIADKYDLNIKEIIMKKAGDRQEFFIRVNIEEVILKILIINFIQLTL